MYSSDADNNLKNPGGEVTVNQLLSAISRTEYPQYILDAIERVRKWMQDATGNTNDNDYEYDPLAAIFEHDFDESGSVGDLLYSLTDLEEFTDVLPNIKTPEGKADTIVISIAPPDYESGLRTAIDYAAVFNRSKTKRVWIIGNTFVFDEIIKFTHHVDALAAQGITLRYILVTPWGWVELPLSGAMVSKNQFVWQMPREKSQVRKRKTRPGRND